MHFKEIFINRHSEVRVGWRLTLFSVALVIAVGLVQTVLSSLGFRLEFISIALILAVVLGVTLLMTRFVNKKPFGAIGLSIHPLMFRELGLGCLIGFLMITGVFLVELASGYIHVVWRDYTLLQSLRVVVMSLLFFAAAALFEEVLYRGYFFQTLMQWITFLPAALILAVVFALSHARNPNVTTFALINVALAGIWLSIAYMKTRSLWLPFGLHASWNFSQTTLYAFPTSGGTFDEQRLADAIQSGPEWITGGAFGPEGGAL
ncbi:MAG: type II CAAX endopeptidase family protein, partial [Bacteroidota bacterium]